MFPRLSLPSQQTLLLHVNNRLQHQHEDHCHRESETGQHSGGKQPAIALTQPISPLAVILLRISQASRRLCFGVKKGPIRQFQHVMTADLWGNRLPILYLLILIALVGNYFHSLRPKNQCHHLSNTITVSKRPCRRRRPQSKTWVQNSFFLLRVNVLYCPLDTLHNLLRRLCLKYSCRGDVFFNLLTLQSGCFHKYFYSRFSRFFWFPSPGLHDELSGEVANFLPFPLLDGLVCRDAMGSR